MTRLIFVMVVPLLFIGCDAGQIARAHDDLIRAEALLEASLAAKAAIDAEVVALPPGAYDHFRDEFQERSDDAGRAVEAAKTVVSDITSGIATAENTLDVAEGVVNTATPFLGPYGPLVGGIGLGVIGLLRSARTKKKAGKAVRALDKAKVNGVVDFNDKDTRTTLAIEMGLDGKSLVDELQGKVRGLPF